MTDFVCERLAKRHDRESFDCGVVELNDYLKNRATQDVRRRVAAVFVLVPKDDPKVIAGYYTLCASSAVLNDLPESYRKKLPRYPQVPAVLIGRLARDKEFPGTGNLLLINAIKRAVENSTDVASTVILVDAKNEAATAFYEKFGFQAVGENSNRMYLPMKTAEKLV